MNKGHGDRKNIAYKKLWSYIWQVLGRQLMQGRLGSDTLRGFGHDSATVYQEKIYRLEMTTVPQL